MKDWLEELRDHWSDAYWHADHPEVKALALAILTGLIGLVFVWLELRLRHRYRLPQTQEV